MYTSQIYKSEREEVTPNGIVNLVQSYLKSSLLLSEARTAYNLAQMNLQTPGFLSALCLSSLLIPQISFFNRSGKTSVN